MRFPTKAALRGRFCGTQGRENQVISFPDWKTAWAVRFLTPNAPHGREAGRPSPAQSLGAEIGEAWQGTAGDRHGFGKHRGGSCPEAVFAVEGLVNDEWFQCLRVAGETEHAVVVAFVVTVAAGAGLGGERREVVGHGKRFG